MGKYVIEYYDRIGLIIVTRPGDPGRPLYLQSESGQRVITDLLEKDELERLEGGLTVEVKDEESRAATLSRLWKEADSELSEEAVEELRRKRETVTPTKLSMRRESLDDDEPRATTLSRLWATDATRLERGLEGGKGKGGCGKRFAEIGVGLLVMAIFIAIFVDLGNAAVFLSMAWCPLVWIPAWPVGWVVLAIIGQVRSSRKQSQRSQTS